MNYQLFINIYKTLEMHLALFIFNICDLIVYIIVDLS